MITNKFAAVPVLDMDYCAQTCYLILYETYQSLPRGLAMGRRDGRSVTWDQHVIIDRMPLSCYGYVGT